MATIGKDIYEAKKLLTEGQVVAIPTETVYGLAGNALNEKVVTTIFEVKNRPAFDPLIVHSNSLEKIQHFVRDFPETAQKLARQFWPGPLTLLLPRKDNIPDLVTSGLENVAVRIPNHPLTLQLLDILDFPLAAPSANPFGYISPTAAAHVQAQLGTQIPYILDGGTCNVGIESTIVGFEEGVIIYRLGGISIEAIEKAVGTRVEVMAHSTSNPAAPGMLKSHYAPRKPVFLQGLESLQQQYKAEDIGILSFQRVYPGIPAKNHVVLSEEGSLAEAARCLFAGLRKLDALPVKVIFAELMPEKELGRAINDRIRRAAAK
ncbi:L-threonylcarbamoyladenylate synthase [Rhodocytophaga aerolata]|uniref:Threonylcarbamoyl-AMP synthase n=1 Tax=Rhodocytophaga aerolata TaxID=455078 RepID=A0ABT8R188_9BACT|nr:L-threonylcarbamoyladenylate synthase [Rhodocytophaga aerolata]MDO1445421.1 L-threonylcarbamoyladenylate synthase [Rhodocytophaga aerolata]